MLFDKDPDDNPESYHDDDKDKNDDRKKSDPRGRLSPLRREPSHSISPPLSYQIINYNSIKAPPPKRFNSSPKNPVNDWLFHMNLYFKAIKTAEEDKITIAALLLEEHVLIW
jgi:hypothetical protein